MEKTRLCQVRSAASPLLRGPVPTRLGVLSDPLRPVADIGAVLEKQPNHCTVTALRYFCQCGTTFSPCALMSLPRSSSSFTIVSWSISDAIICGAPWRLSCVLTFARFSSSSFSTSLVCHVLQQSSEPTLPTSCAFT